MCVTAQQSWSAAANAPPVDTEHSGTESHVDIWIAPEGEQMHVHYSPDVASPRAHGTVPGTPHSAHGFLPRGASPDAAGALLPAAHVLGCMALCTHAARGVLARGASHEHAGLLQRRDVITKHQFALQLLREIA